MTTESDETRKSADARVRPYARADRDRLLARVMEFAAREEFDEARVIGEQIYWGPPPEWASDEDFDVLVESGAARASFVPWFLYDFDLDAGRTPFTTFLERHGRELTMGERAFADVVSRSCVKWYEITGVRPGEGLDLSDVETGAVVRVREKSASRQLVQWELVGARVVPGGSGKPEIENLAYTLPQTLKGELLRALKDARREQARGPFAGDDLAMFRRFCVVVNRIWIQRVALAPLPMLTTTTGEPLAFAKAVFDVSDPARLATILNARKDFDSDGRGTYVWLGGRGGQTLLGGFELKGNRLTVDTMSEDRARQARTLLETIASGIVTFRMTSVEDARERLKAELGHAKAAGPARKRSSRMPPELEATLVQEHLERHYREWVDVPLPALGNRTPRHAARLKTQRPRVVELLKLFESHAARDRLEGRPAYDFAWIWGELGLTRE